MGGKGGRGGREGGREGPGPLQALPPKRSRSSHWMNDPLSSEPLLASEGARRPRRVTPVGQPNQRRDPHA